MVTKLDNLILKWGFEKNKSKEFILTEFVVICWKVVAEPQKMPGFLASGREEFNPGPETRLDHSGLLCNKVLLKYERHRESFWHRHQKGVERVLPH